MNYYPLFRIRLWNNGMRCMSLYIPTNSWREHLHFCDETKPDILYWESTKRWIKKNALIGQHQKTCLNSLLALYLQMVEHLDAKTSAETVMTIVVSRISIRVVHVGLNTYWKSAKNVYDVCQTHFTTINQQFAMSHSEPLISYLLPRQSQQKLHHAHGKS